MKATQTNAEASAVQDACAIRKLLSALKSIERISRLEIKPGYCNVDPIDLLKSVRSMALKALNK